MKFPKACIFLCLIMFLTACAAQTQLQEGKLAFKKQDYTLALTRLYPLAKQGDRDAQYAVGYILYYGKAGVVNKEQGIHWIRESALQNNALAEQALGIIYAQANFSPEKIG